jgi:RHS repeat-associated protein
MQSALNQAFSEPLLAAMPQLSEKPHQGVPSSNPALYLGHEVSKSTTALGLRAALHLERVRSRYTGKERDTESGNDYFGARYYASSMGRFMSPDWSAQAEPVPYAKLDNPQTLNLYSYMGNNPLSGADPDGHCDWCQKLGNWLSGNGWYTNDQVVDQHRSWLLEHVSTDADAKKVNNATPQQVNDTYACLHSSSCTQQMQDYVNALKSAAAAVGGVAPNVQNTLQNIDSTGKAPAGQQGGRDFMNDGRGGGQQLPKTDANGNPIKYQEWDVNAKQPGVNRGTERLVTGSDGSAYYTADHYQTFTQIR